MNAAGVAYGPLGVSPGSLDSLHPSFEPRKRKKSRCGHTIPLPRWTLNNHNLNLEITHKKGVEFATFPYLLSLKNGKIPSMERWKGDLIVQLMRELGMSRKEAARFASYGVTPEPELSFPSHREVINEISLAWSVDATVKEEHDRQSGEMAKLFAERLNMSAEEYMVSLPPFSPSPYIAQYPQEPLFPLIVEGRVPWKEQAKLSGIGMGERLADYDISDWNPKGLAILEKPFTEWVQICYSGEVTRSFNEGHRGAGILEGIAYRNAYPFKVRDSSGFKNALIVLLGTSITDKSSNEVDYRKAVCLDGRSDSSVVNLDLFPTKVEEGQRTLWFHYLGSSGDQRT